MNKYSCCYHKYYKPSFVTLKAIFFNKLSVICKRARWDGWYRSVLRDTPQGLCGNNMGQSGKVGIPEWPQRRHDRSPFN